MMKGFAAGAILLVCLAGGASAQAPAPAAPTAPAPEPSAPAAAPAAPAPAATPATPAPAAADLEAGETSFKKCFACHRIGEGAKNLVGPELNGLDGRKSGTVEGYNYTDANKNSGITWGEDVFREYIRDPRAKIPGTKMYFPGVKNETEITNLWAYLKQFDAQGKKK